MDGPDASLPSNSDKFEESMRYKDGDQRKRRPWEDSDGYVIWPPLRIKVFKVVESQPFEMIMGVVIFFNFGIIIWETNHEAQCHPLPEGTTLEDCEFSNSKLVWLSVVNVLLLLVYTLEVSARGYAEHKKYFNNGWNDMDLFVVFTGWADLVFRGVVPGMAFLKFFRTARLLRMMRIFISFRELYLLVSGLVSVVKTLLFSTVMLGSLLVIWSIVLVEHIHPINSKLSYPGCDRCDRGFASVSESTLTLFQQVVTGDSWGLISVPVIMTEPWTACILVSIVITVSLGLMNLILAVIVERAQDARDQDREDKLRQKELEQEQHKQELYRFCEKMDTDSSGQISLEELVDAYEDITAFRQLLTLMDIQKDELQSVFRLLDKDGSGAVSYEEFCEELNKIRTRDTRTMLTFIKLSITELADQVKHNVLADLKEQQRTMKEHGELLGSLDKQLSVAAPRVQQELPSNAMSPGSPSTQLRPPGRPVGAKVDTLCCEVRDLADIQSGIAQRVEEQLRTLIQHSAWLGSIGVASRLGAGPPAPAKLERVEEKLARMQHNMSAAEKLFEESSAALARNSELLSSLNRELDCQPKARQGPSVADGASQWARSMHKLDQQPRSGDASERRSPAPGRVPAETGCRCYAVETMSPSEQIRPQRPPDGRDLVRR